MKIKEEAVQALKQAGEILKEPEFASVMQRAIYSKTDLTWLGLASTVLPIAIECVENSKVILPSKAKNELVTSVVLPIIKDKLPWYVKPFAGKLISWFIDLIIAALNKLFTKKWGKEAIEIVPEEPKAEGTN